MPADLYLIRKTQQWAKYTAVEALTLTGAISVFGSITSVLGTITVPGSALVVDSQVVFNSIAGGAGLTANTAYWVITASGTSITLSATRGGAAVTVTTNITAGSITVQTDEMRVWSSEYRDIFSSAGQIPMVGSQATQGSTPASITGPGLFSIAIDLPVTVTPIIIENSDEVAHASLRQSLLNRTMWKFDRGASAGPRYLYAYVQEGDIVADNPPETD